MDLYLRAQLHLLYGLVIAWEQGVLRRHPTSSLGPDDAFCAAVAEIQGEFLVIHPFREGNAGRSS